MMRARMLLAGLSALAFAAPAAAQSDHGAHQPPVADQPVAPAKAMACTAEHAAMGHCTLDASPMPDAHGADDADDAATDAEEPHAMPGMAPHPVAPVPSVPACAPEHAAMGHCTPDAPMPPADLSGATGTDLPAGDAPAPAPPGDWYADRIFSKQAMEHSRHEMMVENGGQQIGFIILNLAEYQARKGHDGYRWDAEAWYGGDINRLTIKSEGEGVVGEGIETVETQLLYSRAVGPYFNAQAGVRQDLGPGPDRTYAVIGFEGLAPYWFEAEGALFLSDKGDLLARLEASYDQRITQRLILQPMAEFNLAAQDVPETGVGSGLSDMELGLRLRYEVVKEFAPYIGVEWARKFGDTARFARAGGEGASSVSLVMGLRAWF